MRKQIWQFNWPTHEQLTARLKKKKKVFLFYLTTQYLPAPQLSSVWTKLARRVSVGKKSITKHMTFILLFPLIFLAIASSRDAIKLRWHKLNFPEGNRLKGIHQNKITKQYNKQHKGFSSLDYDLVRGVPTHGKGSGNGGSFRPLPTQTIYDSVISCQLLCKNNHMLLKTDDRLYLYSMHHVYSISDYFHRNTKYPELYFICLQNSLGSSLIHQIQSIKCYIHVYRQHIYVRSSCVDTHTHCSLEKRLEILNCKWQTYLHIS